MNDVLQIKLSRLKDKVARGDDSEKLRVEIEKLEEISYNQILPVDDEMLNTAERLWMFSQKNDVSFDEAFKILLIVKLDNLDRSLNNGVIEVCTSLNERRVC